MAACAASVSIQVCWPCMWPSTITRAWPLPACCPIRKPKPPSPSCTRPWSSSPATVSAYAHLLTDNGSSYRSWQFARACQQLAIKHRRTRPYSPQTNGKAERFIQTALREWAYAKHWTDSDQRDQHLQPWIDYYNRERPHGSLDYSPPISRSDIGTTS